MKLLVVGGAGYVGSTSVERFVEARPRGRRLRQPLQRARRAPFPNGARLEVGDIAGRRAPAAASSPMASMPSSTARPARSSASRWTTRALLPHQRRRRRHAPRGDARTGVTRLVYSSTAAVYGEPRRVPIAEADRTQPINPYGETKLAFEGAMRWFCAAHDFRAISLRYFNVAGATERNGEDHDPETHLMPLVLRVAAGEATHVQIYGQDYPTPDGTCIRDFVHVRDLGNAPPPGARGDGRGRSVARGLQPRLGGRLQRPRGRGGRAPRHRPRHPGPRAQAARRRPAGPRRLIAACAPGARLAADRTRRSSRC